MIDDIQNLPMQAQEEELERKRWDIYLNQPHPATINLMKYRYGQSLPVRASPFVDPSQHVVAVPHPQHKQYSAIEMAKRNKKEDDRKNQQMQHIRYHGHERPAPWIPPQYHPDLLQFRPSMDHFTKPLRFKMPRMYNMRDR